MDLGKCLQETKQGTTQESMQKGSKELGNSVCKEGSKKTRQENVQEKCQETRQVCMWEQ